MKFPHSFALWANPDQFPECSLRLCKFMRSPQSLEQPEVHKITCRSGSQLHPTKEERKCQEAALFLQIQLFVINVFLF